MLTNELWHSMMADKLTVIDLYKSFMQGSQPVEVLQGISITFEQGKTYAITGISGSGKSTFLHLIGGLDKPTSGEISLTIASADAQFTHEIELRSAHPELINSGAPETRVPSQGEFGVKGSERKKGFVGQTNAEGLGLVFQQPYLIRELTVLENVMLKGLIAGRAKSECEAEAAELLEAVGIADKRDAYPRMLSGGQQQRAAIARALFDHPHFLLADEPTGSLDEDTGKKIIDLLVTLSKKWHMGLIISSHDPYVAQKMEEVWVMHHGKLNRKI